MTDSKPPPELDAIAPKVLAYHPKPKSKAAKKRKKKMVKNKKSSLSIST